MGHIAGIMVLSACYQIEVVFAVAAGSYNWGLLVVHSGMVDIPS